MYDATPSARSVPAVTLITSPACHLCDDAHQVLRALADQGRIRLATLRADTSEGSALIDRHRPGLFPLVLLDEAFFSAGRLPRRKLERHLGREVTVG